MSLVQIRPKPPQEVVLKETQSRCLVCRKLKPAQVIKVAPSAPGQPSKVIMRRTCACHGVQDSIISSDARFYWLAQGKPQSGGCGCGTSCSPVDAGKDGTLGKNATDASRLGDVEQLSTCLALIEIVDSCNLPCPTCFAASPIGTHGDKLKYRSFEEIVQRVQGIIDRKGKIEILQFSGGEPTLHPEFFKLVEWVRTNPGIDYLLVNTNGLRLAHDEKFVADLGEAYRSFDNIQLYLQFDGPQQAGQAELRGADMRAIRHKAIEACGRIGLPITLAMTVTRTTLQHLWDTIEFALPFDHIRGVSFQPEFTSGRNPHKGATGPWSQPINVADVLLGLNAQSGGVVSLDDFTPLPCGDPNCATIGWLFRTGGMFMSPSTNGVDIAALQKNLPDRVSYSIEDLKKCGCEGTELGDLMKHMELREANAFRLVVKPFMDERSWDQHRIDRCCTHVIRPDGTLASFCQYYYGEVPAETSCC